MSFHLVLKRLRDAINPKDVRQQGMGKTHARVMRKDLSELLEDFDRIDGLLRHVHGLSVTHADAIEQRDKRIAELERLLKAAVDGVWEVGMLEDARRALKSNIAK